MVSSVEAPKLPLTPVVRGGDFLFISGQVPVKNGKLFGKTIQEQTRQVLSNLRTVLQSAGADLDDVVKTFVVLTNFEEFPGFNETYSKVFPHNPPARTTVGAKLLGDFRVEIEAVAYKPIAERATTSKL